LDDLSLTRYKHSLEKWGNNVPLYPQDPLADWPVKADLGLLLSGDLIFPKEAKISPNWGFLGWGFHIHEKRGEFPSLQPSPDRDRIAVGMGGHPSCSNGIILSMAEWRKVCCSPAMISAMIENLGMSLFLDSKDVL